MPPRINRKYTNNKGDPSTINPFGRGFVMAALNINSLLCTFGRSQIFVLDSKIDVLAINETKIDSSVNDNEIYLPGFEVVRKDRSVNGRSGGGVCIYLRSNINYQIHNDLCDDRLECVFIQIIRPFSDFLLSVQLNKSVFIKCFNKNDIKLNMKATFAVMKYEER